MRKSPSENGNDRRLRGTLTGQSLADDTALVQLRDQVVAALDRYGDGATVDDDITFVLCQFDPARTSASGIGRGAA